jgi:predicted O-methyltransferase YrrM
MSSLNSERVSAVLNRLYAAAGNDQAVVERARAEATRRGLSPTDPEMADLFGNAYLPVDSPSGRFLYALTRAQGSRLVVEFGTSFGISTIYLAAALRDNGAGRVVTTELHAGKVRQAQTNLAEAGLLDLVEIRQGDALETLRNLAGPIDLLFLDGWKALYFPLLRLLEDQLRPGSAIVADDVALFPEHLSPYLEYVRDPANGYVSVEVPLGDHFELSIRDGW